MLKEYVIVDLETTGLSPKSDKIIEIGAIKIREGQEPERFDTYVNPGVPISDRIIELTGITDDMVREAPTIGEIIGSFVEFAKDLPLMGHNLLFDYSFLKQNAATYGYSFDKKGVDTLLIARKYLTELPSKKLDVLCEYFGISDEHHHRAWNDARVTGELYQILCEKFEGLDTTDKSDFEPKPLMYSVKKESPITPRQISYLQDLVMRHGIKLERRIEELSKSEASRTIDNIISRYGRF